jgi:uncharacterized protein (TIGR02145 family)
MLKGGNFLLFLTMLILFFSCGGNKTNQQNKIANDSINAIQGDSTSPANIYDSLAYSDEDNEDDENSIPSVKIGTQIWMAENLKVTTYRNGDDIEDIDEFGINTTHLPKTSTFFCTCSGNKSDDYIYNWYAVNDKRGLAPKGWHIPTDKEWKTLAGYLRTNPLEKIKDTIGWNLHNSFNRYYPGTKDTILHSLLVDCFNTYEIQNFCSFWTSTSVMVKGNYAWAIDISNPEDTTFSISRVEKWYGLPVRCIKDN